MAAGLGSKPPICGATTALQDDQSRKLDVSVADRHIITDRAKTNISLTIILDGQSPRLILFRDVHVYSGKAKNLITVSRLVASGVHIESTRSGAEL